MIQLGNFFSILYIPSKRDVLSLAHCRLWYWKSSSRESYAEEWEPWLLWCCIVEPAHMNLHRLGMACLYLDWPMRILSGMSFLLILGLFAKDKVLILFGCSSECSTVDGWEVHLSGKSNQFNTVGYTCQSCSFATTLTSIFGRLAQQVRATGSAPKAREVRAAALPQSWQVTGRYEPDLWSKKN